MAKTQKTYKQRKEEFVSNHYGGTILEINLVTAVAPVAYILYSVLQSRLRFFTPYGPLQYITDAVLNSLAILFAITAYSSYPVLLNVLILAPAIFIYATQKPPSQKSKLPELKKSKDEATEKLPSGELVMSRKAFLTIYRGCMIVVTCVAILAVDFPVFPRRFAKVENWGTSLMDLGVGSFVFSSGVVSARGVLREIHAFQQAYSQKVTYIGVSAGKRVAATVRSALPLFILGFVRLASVKGTDYAEHITEYGYHWNFFFTLALVPPFVNFFQSLLYFLPSRFVTVKHLPIIYAILSILVASTYQAILETTGLKRFILVGEREPWGLIGWNKEGLFSFFGYLAIFLSGMSAGGYLLPSGLDTAPTKKSVVGPMGKRLLMWSAFWVFAAFVTIEYRGLGLVVSRRIANLPYVLWIAAFNTCQITAFYLIESFFFGINKATGVKRDQERYKLATSPILETFNNEGLPLFLIANVLTGVINLSINTLDIHNTLAVGLLVGYTLVLTLIAKAIGRLQVRKYLSI